MRVRSERPGGCRPTAQAINHMGALRAAALDRTEILRVPALAFGPFPSAARSPYPDRPSRPALLAPRRKRRVACTGPGRLCRPARSGAPPPAVETRDTGAQSVSDRGNGTRVRSVDALTSDCGRRATTPTRCAVVAETALAHTDAGGKTLRAPRSPAGAESRGVKVRTSLTNLVARRDEGRRR